MRSGRCPDAITVAGTTTGTGWHHLLFPTVVFDLCGDPFPVSAMASVPSKMDKYLYTRSQPEISGADGTEMAYASNDVMHNNA